MSLGHWFCMNGRVGQGEVDWYTQRVARSGLGFENPSVRSFLRLYIKSALNIARRPYEVKGLFSRSIYTYYFICIV